MQSAKKWQASAWAGCVPEATKICCGFVKRAATQKTNRSGNKSLTARLPYCPSYYRTPTFPLLMTYICLTNVTWPGMGDAALHRLPRDTFTYVLPHVRSTPVLVAVAVLPAPCPSPACRPACLLFFLKPNGYCQSHVLMQRFMLHARCSIRLPEILRLSYEQATTFVNTRSCINAA